MNLNDYQDAALDTLADSLKGEAVRERRLSYLALGLAGEAGEVANKVKKALRDNGGVMDDATAMAVFSEISDVLWYVAVLAAELYPASLDDLAAYNLRKLQSRKARGVIGGNGDHR